MNSVQNKPRMSVMEMEKEMPTSGVYQFKTHMYTHSVLQMTRY